MPKLYERAEIFIVVPVLAGTDQTGVQVIYIGGIVE